ncbi:MAG TPA: FAD-dependent oxidoreductase [Stellaceae bacterium]|nr:FAD-dependent oxidoreductase [Stellaceae bacterium]
MAAIFDVLVIGGGAAGASVGYELSRRGRVALVEREAQPGCHSTGRSAAVIAENYGPAGWRVLTTASRPFFENPPDGFSEHPLLRRRGALFLATAEEAAALRRSAADLARRGARCELMPAADALRLCPVLRAETYALALYEPGCADIDTNALLQGYLRLARRNGAAVHFGAEAASIRREDGLWQVACGAVSLAAPVLVNAAGAWADRVAELAGLRRRGVTPYRRTAITFDPPEGSAIEDWPMTFDVAETWYFKPESGRVMVSPVDKTPSEPCDCQPDELGVALAADRIERATTMRVRQIRSRWAGLRSFAPDEEPVIGPDPEEPSFIWYAGQGGNGVMAAPAAAALAAACALGETVPEPLARLGIAGRMTDPARLPPFYRRDPAA